MDTVFHDCHLRSVLLFYADTAKTFEVFSFIFPHESRGRNIEHGFMVYWSAKKPWWMRLRGRMRSCSCISRRHPWSGFSFVFFVFSKILSFQWDEAFVSCHVQIVAIWELHRRNTVVRRRCQPSSTSRAKMQTDGKRSFVGRYLEYRIPARSFGALKTVDPRLYNVIGLRFSCAGKFWP